MYGYFLFQPLSCKQKVVDTIKVNVVKLATFSAFVVTIIEKKKEVKRKVGYHSKRLKSI